MNKLRFFSLLHYLEAALALAEYERNENGVVIAQVVGAAGFFAQGDTFEEARLNLRDVIEGNVLLALQLGFAIPSIRGIIIEERDAQALPA
jgi:predicted RNase H-like HicB family nuclease